MRPRCSYCNRCKCVRGETHCRRRQCIERHRECNEWWARVMDHLVDDYERTTGKILIPGSAGWLAWLRMRGLAEPEQQDPQLNPPSSGRLDTPQDAG